MHQRTKIKVKEQSEKSNNGWASQNRWRAAVGSTHYLDHLQNHFRTLFQSEISLRIILFSAIDSTFLMGREIRGCQIDHFHYCITIYRKHQQLLTHTWYRSQRENFSKWNLGYDKRSKFFSWSENPHFAIFHTFWTQDRIKSLG